MPGSPTFQDVLDEQLIEAARSGNIDYMRDKLKEGADPNRFHGAALMAAAQRGHVAVAKVLSAHGAMDQWKDEAMVEASAAGHAEFVRYLIAHGGGNGQGNLLVCSFPSLNVSQGDKPDTVNKISQHILAQSLGQMGFAHAANTQQGHKSFRLYQTAQTGALFAAPHKRFQLLGQIVLHSGWAGTVAVQARRQCLGRQGRFDAQLPL